MYEASLYHKREDGRVECFACAHRCKINFNQRGICGVRKNVKGKLYLLVFGKAVAFNLDPIEKKPLFHFLPGTQTLSIGTIGCNFKCDFCQNFEIAQYPKNSSAIIGKDLPPEYLVDYALKNNIPSIAYTYNEPTVFFEYTFETAKLAHQYGIKNIYVSNGFQTPEALEKIAPYLDAINIDLKSFSEDFYLKICGGRLAPVLENIKLAHHLKIWTEITTLVIPNQNDSTEELKKIADFIAMVNPDIPWHISRFFPYYKMNNLAPTYLEKLEEAYQIGKKSGLNYVYIGNIQTDCYENTDCPQCQTELIERFGYKTDEFWLKKGECPQCQNKIKGIWKKN